MPIAADGIAPQRVEHDEDDVTNFWFGCRHVVWVRPDPTYGRRIMPVPHRIQPTVAVDRFRTVRPYEPGHGACVLDISSLKGTIMATKKASAVWKGGIKDGGGTISTETGVLKDAPYGFKSRFENGPGTNPEELIGAAHAGCFSMALSLMLGNEALTAERMGTPGGSHARKSRRRLRDHRESLERRRENSWCRSGEVRA